MSFEYETPKTLAEASRLAASALGESQFLLGGTDLTVGLRHGHIKTRLVIDLKRVAELSAHIATEQDHLRIVGGVTMTSLFNYLTKNEIFPALAEAARVVGSIQIRNRATLIGNICNASPAADTVPVFAALGAEVEIYGEEGIRHRSVADFILGNRKIDLGAAELVTGIRIPLSKSKAGSAFERITRRKGVDLATVNLCCCIDDRGKTTFAFGAASPAPLVVHDDSGVLADIGTDVGKHQIRIEQMTAVARPISDVRASARYRQEMLNVMARRALSRVHQQINPVAGQ